jgi:hypothetical protein
MSRTLVAATSLALTLLACKQEPPPNLAPVAQPIVAPQAATATAVKLTVLTASSSASWLMDAPREKIFGELPGGLSGELYVDASDLTKTTGLVHVNLGTMLLSQEKMGDGATTFGARTTEDKQNEHARTWLEISADAPAEARAKNAQATLVLKSVTTTGAADLGKLSGEERTIKAKITGDLVLHGRQTSHTIDVAVTGHYAGDTLVALHVKTLSPLTVNLESHDVRPRDAFGKLAKNTLAKLSHAVAATAPVNVVIVARP